MTIAAVGFGSLGLPGGEFSGPAAVVWNSVYIVAACGGGTPDGLVKETRTEKLPDPSDNQHRQAMALRAALSVLLHGILRISCPKPISF
jgi:hypothetical protein